MAFRYENAEEIEKPPESGVYIRGIYLQGARWNRNTMELDESLSKVMFDLLPIIWLKPGIKADFIKSPVYHAPLYKTSERRGVLATTGHSSNFVMVILLASSVNEDHWIARGVACLCQLDD